MKSKAHPFSLRWQSVQLTSRLSMGLSKAELLTVIVAVLVVNAVFQIAMTKILEVGWLQSVGETFGISAIVWAGVFISLRFFSKIDEKQLPVRTKFVFLLALLSAFLPSGQLIWPVLTLFAVYLIVEANDANHNQKRGAWVLLAITVPMFWSKRIFGLFSDVFLSFDAILVSSITGTSRTANIVAMPGGEGYLQIAAPCSSMANVSLAILAWVLFSQSENLERRTANYVWCLIACLCVVLINVSRISLIGYFPQHYELIHGSVGSAIASWISLLVIISVCVVGVRNVKNSGS